METIRNRANCGLFSILREMEGIFFPLGLVVFPIVLVQERVHSLSHVASCSDFSTSRRGIIRDS